MPSPRDIEVIRLPRPIGYREAYDLQLARRDAVERGDAPNALFLLEHAPVITLGRKWQPENLLASEAALAAHGVELCPVDRGGDVTYHGPGQLVAYPILNLNHWQCSVGWYLRTLEEVLIRTLATYSLPGERVEGFTGVWVNGAKVAAIGIGLHHWTTFHGVALNINPDMSHFRLIVPCGIADKPVTSLGELLPEVPDFEEVMARFEAEFLRAFG
jgi:lipoate-protein ligase B